VARDRNARKQCFARVAMNGEAISRRMSPGSGPAARCAATARQGPFRQQRWRQRRHGEQGDRIRPIPRTAFPPSPRR